MGASFPAIADGLGRAGGHASRANESTVHAGHGGHELFDDIRRYLDRTDAHTTIEQPVDSSATKPLVVVAAATEAVATAPPPADYVNPQICSACHTLESQNWAHTIHAKVFTLNPGTELESQGCQACHGPASRHLGNPAAPQSIIRFTHGGGTPVSVQNEQCQTCHRGGQRIFWSGSAHERRDVACSDCHNPQATLSARGLTARRSINETCFQCHATKRVEFRLRSHKPLLEGQVSCTDCHNPHGSTAEPLIKARSVNETCYGCHADKRGPFLFEHAPVRDSCLNCHAPHGSNHENLLKTPGPLLCQQCHIQQGHDALLMTRGNMATGPIPDIRLLGSNCAACHSQVHGSNSPAGPRFQR